jgi:hypothetical protein
MHGSKGGRRMTHRAARRRVLCSTRPRGALSPVKEPGEIQQVEGVAPNRARREPPGLKVRQEAVGHLGDRPAPLESVATIDSSHRLIHKFTFPLRAVSASGGCFPRIFKQSGNPLPRAGKQRAGSRGASAASRAPRRSAPPGATSRRPESTARARSGCWWRRSRAAPRRSGRRDPRAEQGRVSQEISDDAENFLYTT